ncbi:MAG: PEGA domain-containing protein, partial [Lentisphaeria bacterium]|nr:PEGA domain-containing protein [Lentisphaeria bacterium]
MKNIFLKKMLQVLLILAAVLLITGVSGCSKKKKAGKISVTYSGPTGMTMSYKGQVKEGLTRKLYPGTYVFKFTAPGYKPLWKEVVVSSADNNTTTAISMEAQKSAIMVRCSIEDTKKDGNVTVMLDGEEQGVTPCLITGVTLGSHILEFSHPGYATKSRQILIEDARPLPQIRESLVSISGMLRVSGSPAGAMLYIDDKLAGPIPYQAKYTAGKYLLELRAPGYISRKQEISIQANADNKAEFRLKPEPSSLFIESIPANAVCVVRGEKRGTTPLHINNLQPGNYKVELS